jgi:hypothetical protein
MSVAARELAIDCLKFWSDRGNIISHFSIHHDKLHDSKPQTWIDDHAVVLCARYAGLVNTTSKMSPKRGTYTSPFLSAQYYFKVGIYSSRDHQLCYDIA